MASGKGDLLQPAEMLGRLVAFNTVSARSNQQLIDHVAAYLAGYGLKAELAQSPDGEKFDLIATIGPSEPGGVILSGHTDVVPVEGQDWSSDPFTLRAADGRLYGRGTADMKGFIATALALVPEFLSLGLRRPLHLVLSYDEEVGCLGAPGLIRRFQTDFPDAVAAIIGEPTSMKLVNAHKGITAFETSITGRPGHSSNPDAGVSAITVAAELIDFLQSLATDFKSRGGDARFQPPHATLSVGTIVGGNAINIIAENCTLGWECRSVAGDEAAEAKARTEFHCTETLLPAMRNYAPETVIETKCLANVPPLRAGARNSAEELVRHLTGQNQAGVISFAAEAGLFQEAGIDAVICGPGSIEQAHQANEYVEVRQLDECAAFFRKLAKWAAGAS
ncbi:MAG: acetylornithine deacetylase [Pseudomonadota bacterium]|nr:acetylornithine deacetylase [Pseudomonadota bacterium]